MRPSKYDRYLLKKICELEKLKAGKCETKNIAANSSQSFEATAQNFNSAFADVSSGSQEIIPIGVIDPTNISTTEANLINGNYTTDLTYHNSSVGSTNKELPAIDLGSNVDVSEIYIHWYTATFIATTFRIEYSTDGINFSSTGIFTGTWTGSSATPQVVNIGIVNARYFRIFSITGLNANWTVVREMRAFGLPSSSDLVSIFNVDGLTMKDNGTNVVICNDTDNDIEVKVCYGCVVNEIEVPVDRIKALILLDANGDVISIEGASSSVVGTGRRLITLDQDCPDDKYHIFVQNYEPFSTRDDIEETVDRATVTPSSFEVYMGEQDNGGSAGVLRDRIISIMVVDIKR